MCPDLQSAGWQKVRERLVSGIREYFSVSGFTKAVLGLSGGIDSALAAKLACEALEAENVTLLIMPELGVSSEQATKQAEGFAEALGAKRFTMHINRFVEAFEKPNKRGWEQSKLARMNLKARVRMLLLYSFANSNKALVLGAGNRSEIMLGYFTKHGDEAADLLVLGELWKSQAYELARHMKLPKHFLECRPSAELYKGQSDEAELGADYSTLDRVLLLYVDEGKGAEEIAEELARKPPKHGVQGVEGKGAERKIIDGVIKRIKSTEHKRAKPQAVKSGLF